MRTGLAMLALWALAACAGDSDMTTNPNTGEPETFDSQVARGQQVYAANCARCHGDSGQGTQMAPRVVGLDQGALPLKAPAERKVRREDFLTVADVANFVVANMPPDKPGSLPTADYWAVLAFDLKANGVTLERPLDLALAESLTIPR